MARDTELKEAATCGISLTCGVYANRIPVARTWGSLAQACGLQLTTCNDRDDWLSAGGLRE